MVKTEHPVTLCTTGNESKMPYAKEIFSSGRTLCRILRQTGIDPNPSSVFELVDFPFSADHNATEQSGSKAVLRIGSSEWHV